MILAIYTPTYNRAEKLQVLYRSLIEQTDKEFFWLIIDDGSIDGTYEIVKKWQESAAIDIRYIKKDNGGKHSAINVALDIVDNYWNICIDSDDWLITNKSLEIVKKDIEEYGNGDERIVSIVYPLQLIGKKIENMNRQPIFLKKIKKMPVSETTIVSSPNAYKGIRFPIYENETFMGEDAIEVPKLNKGSRVYINSPIVEGEYLDSGLTNNILLYWEKNPEGYYYVRNLLADNYKKNNQYLQILRPLGQIVAFNFNNKKSLLNHMDNKCIGLFSIPFGLLYWVKRFKKSDI